jgi:predicted esterase
MAPELPRPDPPAPRFIPVSGDAPAWVAPAFDDTPRVVVYLHGMCGDPARGSEWARVVQQRATLIALRGGVYCKAGGGHYWRGDPTYLDYRITKAIRSVAQELGRPLDDSRVVLFGYSQGAQRAEDLAWIFSSRYRRVALMSGPTTPYFPHVSALRRLAIVRGQREYEKPYRESAIVLAKMGVRTKFFELPGAHHGEFGPNVTDVFTKVLDFLLE